MFIFFLLISTHVFSCGILDTVLWEGVYFKTVSEYSSDRKIETRKYLDQFGILLKEETFQEGKQRGPLRIYENGHLRHNNWMIDAEKKKLIAIRYDDFGRVDSARCVPGIMFTPEHEVVCGFKNPYSYTSLYPSGEKEEVTIIEGMRKSKKTIYYHDTSKPHVVIDEENGIIKEVRYDQQGKIISRKVAGIREDSLLYSIKRKLKSLLRWRQNAP